jgi:hypothetical protein
MLVHSLFLLIQVANVETKTFNFADLHGLEDL